MIRIPQSEMRSGPDPIGDWFNGIMATASVAWIVYWLVYGIFQ